LFAIARPLMAQNKKDLEKKESSNFKKKLMKPISSSRPHPKAKSLTATQVMLTEKEDTVAPGTHWSPSIVQT
jgi:hypothetical protein